MIFKRFGIENEAAGEKNDQAVVALLSGFHSVSQRKDEENQTKSKQKWWPDCLMPSFFSLSLSPTERNGGVMKTPHGCE